MFKELRKNPKALFLAILLHVFIIFLLVLSFQLSDRPSVKPNEAIQVTEEKIKFKKRK